MIMSGQNEGAIPSLLGVPHSAQAHSCRRQSAKAHKVLEGKLRFVMGHDVYMDRVEALCSQALIGRLEYVQMGKKEWISCAMEH